MGLAGIITLIVLGIILIFLEFFVVPGITVAGIGGLILLVLGIYFSYSSYGVATGNALLLTTFGALGLIFYVAYKTGAWKKITLSTEVKSTSKEDVSLNVKVGDTGKTVSRLAPMGTIMINNELFEASSKGVFIDENTEIEIIRIVNNKIIVKPKN
jgi:membrane-bound ClpP family serine protease